jgi:hypothetical protein
VGDWFEVHQGGVAQQSSAPHGDGSRNKGERQWQAGTVAIAVGLPVREECGTRVELGEMAA